MESLEFHHPNSVKYVLIVDGKNDSIYSDNFNIINISDINIPNLNNFLFRYDILEANTAAKPFMFQYLFNLGFNKVIYLDPDIYLFKPMEELDKVKNKLMVLTPHILEPVTNKNATKEITILNCGTFNLGFIALYRHHSLNRFLDWWKSKLEYECIVNDKLFVDQKWIDLAIGFFEDIYILRDKSYNISYWNIFERDIDNLTFFHFSGITENEYSKYNLNVNNSTIEEKVSILYRNYGERLKAENKYSNIKYKYSEFSNSNKIDKIYREMYRSSTLNRNTHINPFDSQKLFSNNMFIKQTSVDRIGFYENEPAFMDKYLWIAKEASIKLPANSSNILIEGIHDTNLNPDIEILCLIDNDIVLSKKIFSGVFKIEINIDSVPYERVLTISCDKSFIPSSLKLNKDDRELSTRIGLISVDNVDIFNVKKK